MATTTWIGVTWTPLVFIFAPLVIAAVLLVVFLALRQRDAEGWDRLGSGLLRLKITGGWLVRYERSMSRAHSMTFVLDPYHENPPEILYE